jgi:hypothetical protein
MARKPNPKTCEFCPHRHEAGCPMWVTEAWGIIEKDAETGRERLMTGCFYPNMIRAISHCIGAANHAQAAVEGARNENVHMMRTLVEVGLPMLANSQKALGDRGEH